MNFRPLPASRAALSASLCASLLSLCGCQVSPPPSAFEGAGGVVRASAPEEAQRVSGLLEELEPRVRALLPDAVDREVEVWVQARPALYHFEGAAYSEADGFWSENHGRIHLREASGSLRRTLAHELVHASLGASWGLLPGSIEEGLCDLVSVRLAPEEAVDMRAGRLAAAAFATGGLELEVAVEWPAPEERGGIVLGTLSRLRLAGEVSGELAPEDVFRVAAGLSNTRLATNDKKALYGLSYLLVERIVERVGLEGLHGLCLRAAKEGRERVPTAWLLAAAELGEGDEHAWRVAIHRALGARELRTILLLYPEAVLAGARRLFGEGCHVGVDLTGASPLRARVELAFGTASVELGLFVEPLDAGARELEAAAEVAAAAR